MSNAEVNAVYAQEIMRLEKELGDLHQDASSKWAFLEWRTRAEEAEAENATLQEQLEACKTALRELDLTGIQYYEKPVDAVSRMRGIAMDALKRLPKEEGK
jgi:hypothetical protein